MYFGRVGSSEEAISALKSGRALSALGSVAYNLIAKPSAIDLLISDLGKKSENHELAMRLVPQLVSVRSVAAV